MTSYNLGRVVGNGITSIEKTGTSGNIDTYTITFTNGDTTTFTVTNGEDATDAIVTSWEDTLSDEKIPSEKLVKEYVDGLIGDIQDYINR